MKNLNDMTEEEQIEFLKKDPFPFAIQYIDNPSERVQLVAVNLDGYAIHYIKNPSKDALITAMLILLHAGNIDYVDELLNKYSDKNYPEFKIIRQSIEADI